MNASQQAIKPTTQSAGRSSRRRTIRRLIIASFVFLAAFLRLHNITKSGIWDMDEGLYLTDAHAVLTEWHWCADLVRHKWFEMHGGPAFYLADYLPRMRTALAGETNFAGKHGYYYLIAAIMVFAGPKVWTGIAIDAVAGTIAVWVLYRYVAALHTKRAGLIAAALLAVSGYHVFYSRRVYGTAIIALLFTLALLAHVEATKKHGTRNESWLLYLCGVCTGLCFIINFQIAVLLPVLPLIHVLTSRRNATLREHARWLLGGSGLIALGFFTPVLLVEATSYPLIMLFRSKGLDYPHGTFLERVTPKLTSHLEHHGTWWGLILFPFFLSVLEGWPVFLACALLPALALWSRTTRTERASISQSRNNAILYLGVSFLVPFLIFSLKTPQSSRIFVNCLPPFFAALGILAAIAWDAGANKTIRRSAVVLILCAVVISSLIHDAESLHTRSALPDTMEWLSSTPERSASAPYGVVLFSYLREYGLKGGSYTTFQAYKIAMPPYLVTDRAELWDKNYPDTSAFLSPSAQPIKRFENVFGRMMLEADAFPPDGIPLDSVRWVRSLDLRRARQILVYDIRQPGIERGIARAPGKTP